MRHKSEEAVNELEMQLDLRQKFFSLVAHDLRTPLTTAKLCAKLLQKKLHDRQAAEQLAGRIVKSIARADRLIGDLLDANRLRAGLPVLIHAKSCDLAEIVRSAVRELTPIHHGRCIYEGRAQLMGRFDPMAIRRALENLIVNAVKYGAGSGKIRVSTSLEGDRAKISVRNEGRQLNARERKALFNWHGRATEHEQRAKPGWGLGLMLVKGIAEAHGGEISVESGLKTGTVFTLRLPLKKKNQS
jgi:signal transduction histidine kinase